MEYYHELQKGSQIKDSIVNTGNAWQNRTIRISAPFDSWKKNNDTIYVIKSIYGFYGAVSGQYTLSFLIDSIDSEIKNFTINSSDNDIYTGSSSCLGSPYNSSVTNTSSSYLRFSKMNYINSGDSALSVSLSGVDCMNHIDTFNYFNYYTSSYYWRGDSKNCWNTYKSLYLIRDSSEASCSIIFSKIQKSSVPNIDQIHFYVTWQLYDHTVHFSFPSFDHSQTISIYDILGREVKRIEIPSGVSEYRLQRDGFMSGYYFARLGNLNAKFVVN